MFLNVSEGMELALILITLLLSGFFSASEIVFVVANRLKLEVRARKRVLGARTTLDLAKKPERWPISTRMPLLLELEHFCRFLRGGDAPLTGSAEAAGQVAMLERLRGMAMRALR